MKNTKTKTIAHIGDRVGDITKDLLQHVDGIEFDVRMTRDKKIVLSHDRRISNGNGRYMWIDRIDSADVTRVTEESPPTLDMALNTLYAMLPPGKKIMIEFDIKQYFMEERLSSFLKKHQVFSRFSEVIVSSPNVLVLQKFDQCDSRLSLALTDVPFDRWDLWSLRLFRYPMLILQFTLKPFIFRMIRRKTTGKDIHIANVYHRHIEKRVVDFFHEHGIRVFVYGTKSKKKAKRLVSLGVDGIKVKKLEVVKSNEENE